MLRLLQLLFFGHVHKWREDDRERAFDELGDPIGMVVYCTCEKCGKPKRFRMIG